MEQARNVHLGRPERSRCTLSMRDMNNVPLDAPRASRSTLRKDPLPYPAAVDLRRHIRNPGGEPSSRAPTAHVEPSPPPVTAPAGQAAVDYTGLLAVVAVTLAVAGAAAGLLAAVPASVAQAMRTGICIVGGDVCRTSDARADGLSPCVVSERAKGAGLTVSIALLRIGESGEWSAARRSDGTVLVTHSRERRVGAGGGIGASAGVVEVGAAGSLDLTAATGEAWELPSVAAAAKLIAGVRGGHAGIPPTWRFGDAGGEASAGVGVSAFGTSLTAVEADGRAAAGVRMGRGERTVFIHVGATVTGPVDLLPGGNVRGSSEAPGGGPTGPLMLAVTRDANGLRELEYRHVQSGARSDEVVETLGRLDLREPANRALAERLLRVRLPWPPSVAGDLRAVIARTTAAGTIERSVYAVADSSHDFDAAVRLGAQLGVDASLVDVTRHLIAASAWTRGSPERRRVDCLGEEA